MGIKKTSRLSAAVKGSNKHLSQRSRARIRSSTRSENGNSRHGGRDKAKSFPAPKRTEAPRFSPLFKLFSSRGMSYGCRSILRTTRNDYQLRRKFAKLGIRNKKHVEEALLELLFEFRNLKDWVPGGDNMADVFRLLKGRVKWAAGCSVDLIMQLFFALLRARLGCPVSLCQYPSKVALRVDKVILYINGVDHLLTEYEIYQNLAFPLHHAIRNLPKKYKIPPSGLPGAVFLQAISCKSK